MSLSVTSIANSHHSSSHYPPASNILNMLNSNPQDNRYLYNQFNQIKYTNNVQSYQYDQTNSPTNLSESQDYTNPSPLSTHQSAQSQLQQTHPPLAPPVGPAPSQLQMGPSSSSMSSSHPHRLQPQSFSMYGQHRYSIATPPPSAQSYQPSASGIVNSLPGGSGSNGSSRASYPYLSYQYPQGHQPPLSQQQQQQPQTPLQQSQFGGQQQQQPQLQQYKYAYQPPQSAPAASGGMNNVAGASTAMYQPANHTVSSSISNPEQLPPFSYPSAQQSQPSHSQPQQHQQQPLYLSDANPAPTGPISEVAVGSSSSAIPKLVRTTSLPINKANVNGAYPSNFPQESAKYPRVILHIHGDLAAMTTNWSDQELEAKRRLVKFEWNQVGTGLEIKFKPIEQDQYEKHHTVVSCLMWKRRSSENSNVVKDSYYVTSVDVIQLLEHLVNQRFAVEEKNRIRRNLQGLRPLTIARSKQDFSDFFQQIMKYQEPRPRNIEKDVKVFKWSSLAEALQRVLSKYSCDYSHCSVPPHMQQQQPLLPNLGIPSEAQSVLPLPVDPPSHHHHQHHQHRQSSSVKLENTAVRYDNSAPQGGQAIGQLPHFQSIQQQQQPQTASNIMGSSPMLNQQAPSADSSPALNYNTSPPMYNAGFNSQYQPQHNLTHPSVRKDMR